jgi:hypothetical protein
MATKINILTECDKCGKSIEDPEVDGLALKIERTDAPSEILEIDLHQACADSLYLPDELIRGKRPRRRLSIEEQVDAALREHAGATVFPIGESA